MIDTMLTGDDAMYTPRDELDCWLSLADKHDDILEHQLATEQMLDAIDVAVDTTDYLVNKIALNKTNEMNNDSYVKLSIESMRYSCTMLGIDVPAHCVSIEALELTLSVENEVSFLERIINAIRDTYHRVVKSIKDITLKIFYTMLDIDKATESLRYHVNNLKSDVPFEKLSYEDKSNVNRKFGAILAMNAGNENSMDKLLHLLLETEKSIVIPKTTDNLTQELRKDIYTTKLDIVDVTKKYLMVNNHNPVVIKLNHVFYGKLDKDMSADVDKEHVSVVEYSGHKCSGVVLSDNTMNYITVEAQGVLTNEDTLVKKDILKLLDILTRLNNQFLRFKEHVDKDIHSMNQFLDNLRYKITYMESSENNELYKNNIRVVNHVTKAIPRIANGNVINYYIFIKNLLWLAKLNYNKIYENEQV